MRISSNQQTIAAVVARIREWIRNELVAKDPALRQRAEEALAAMIGAALMSADDTASSDLI